MCKTNNLLFYLDTDLLSPDSTTLFCSSGMQKHKEKFLDLDYQNTFCNIQRCFRTTDLDDISDGKHLLCFDMIGYFSFRQKSLQDTINFFLEFLRLLNIPVNYVTIHPDKINDWSILYPPYLEIRADSECIWSDGNIGGFCTEFYSNNLEIGNIVNTLGTCIDVGFGLERLNAVLTGDKIYSEIEVLEHAVISLLNCGIIPSSNKHGYILRKLIRMLIRLNHSISHEEFEKEEVRFRKTVNNFYTLWPKNKTKTSFWWKDTHGIILEEMVIPD